MASFNWTPDERETMRRMFAEQATARQVADTLKRSEAAIVAQRYRVDLAEVRQGLKPSIRRQFKRREGNIPPVDPAIVARFEALPAPEGALRIPLLELGEHHCRWPLGDLYCGAAQDKGSYCSFHNRIAHASQP